MIAAANNNEPEMSASAFNAMRAIPDLDSVELRMVIAAACGALQKRMGAAHTAKIIARIMSELRAGGDMPLHEVAFYVAQKHFLLIADMTAPSDAPNSRCIDISHARQEAFWLARQQRKPDGAHRHSLVQIGRYFGGRDHTTVLHGVRQHQLRLLSEAI